jgi:hypothetical protein
MDELPVGTALDGEFACLQPLKDGRTRPSAPTLRGESQHGGGAYGRVRRGERKTWARVAGRWRGSPRTAEPMRRQNPSRGTSRKRSRSQPRSSPKFASPALTSTRSDRRTSSTSWPMAIRDRGAWCSSQASMQRCSRAGDRRTVGMAADQRRPQPARDETARRGLRRWCPGAGLASGAPGQGLCGGERRLGRPSLRWPVSPTSPLWPPLPLTRLCREHESVLVVCPPGLPS